MRDRREKQTIEFWSLPEDALVIDDVRDNVDQILFLEKLDEILQILTERERVVLKARFWDRLTLADSGKLIGSSGAWARQIESRAVRKLRQPHTEKKLREFFLGWETFDKRRKKEKKELKERQKREYEEYEKNRKLSLERQRPLNPHVYQPRISIVHPVVVKPAPVETASEFCPSSVVLDRKSDGTPFLKVIRYWNSIDRTRDPKTYDRWLSQRIKEEQRDLMENFTEQVSD